MPPLNSIPAMGNPVSKKQVHKALKAPLAAIADSDGTNNTATINAVLAALRTLGFISA